MKDKRAGIDEIKGGQEICVICEICVRAKKCVVALFHADSADFADEGSLSAAGGRHKTGHYTISVGVSWIQ